ncbi:MAG: hypothetical protein K2J99_06260 [Lachnospiraceae bacterium]|nr:hypothetical protein [Lachnospiraceae bacterium]
MDMEWEDGIKFQVRENRAELVCGVFAIGISVFTFIMWMFHPSGEGGGVLLYLPLLCMIAAGVLFLVIYFHRRLIVDDMNICYVNWIGKRKEFTLDEIGFCKIGGRGANNMIVLYDLLGEKLCKLGIDVRGFEELHQYLVDNQVRVEWNKSRMSSESALLIDTLQQESAVCEEEIRKCSEKFYEEIERIFREWEKRNKKFDVQWEIGFVEYTLEDMEKKCRFRDRTSSIGENLKTLPLSYECLLEAYLKCGEEYIVGRKGEEINVILPYLVRSKSYRIGEGTRIRKVDEQGMKEWLEMRLEGLAKELPRHRYHTETFTIQHSLRKTAGLAESIRDIH